MGEASFRAFDLPPTSSSTQVRHNLKDIRDSGRTKRMSFRQ